MKILLYALLVMFVIFSIALMILKYPITALTLLVILLSFCLKTAWVHLRTWR